ncbi:MAG TPA: sigma-70 family RNA polymerase sigma factor [Lachnospiraceae bacterium]|nr:sigma-70 family RNA polymerase sigma factor [Lachnospiraceae bacterium]HPF30678.1 sigma-70 family RNA polymerase sigma factor [Lachnospiraceae bacterium]
MKRLEKEKIVVDILTTEYNRFFRLAYSYTQNEEDARDIVQEGAYKAILNSDSLRKTEYAMTWLYRIMLNETFRYCKKQRKQITEELTEKMTEQLEGKPQDTDQYMDLKSALCQLEMKDQAVVTLRYFEDMKIADIAKLMKENENTIKSRLYRSMDKLKITLKDGE